MQIRRNPDYGKTKCFQYLLSPDREEATIFIGINKAIARALDTDSSNSSSIYPCPILNRYECPYDKKKSNDKDIDVNYLFSLSEMAFALELASAKAIEEDSVVRIRNVEDVYHALRDKETLEKILEQGLTEEYNQYKDQILEFFVSIRDKIKIEDLTF